MVRTAEQTIGESIAEMVKQVDKSNKNVDENITSILDRAGFRRAGASFSRNVISGSSLIGGNEYDTQKINAYSYFVAPQFTTTVNLRDDVVAEMSQEGINALVAKAIRELQQQVKEVLSGPEKKGDTVMAAIGGADSSSTEKSVFQQWVGDQAKLVKNPNPKHVKFEDPGSGEMGRIFQKFLEDEVIRSAGEAEAKAPFYSKPLWGTILGIEGPSIRGIIDVALSIVSNVIKVVPAIGWLVSGVINSIDDFVFTGLDIANGMDADEAWLSFGKKAACNLITGGLGALGNAAGTALKLGTDVAGVIGKTAIAGVQAFASNAATGAINAIDFNSSGQLSFNSKSWQNSMFGKDALVGYAGTMGMTFAMEGLNSAILGEGTITGYDAQTNQNLWSYRNFEFMDVTNIKSITRLAGGALKAGMEYGFTGQTTLNVLQIGGTGVMEMRLGGNRPMFGIGMNGIDASIGTFASAIQGLRDIGKNNQIVEATKNNLILGNASEREKAAKLRMQYSFGDAKDRLQLDNILAGRDTLTIGSDVPEGIPDNTRGKTVLNGENGRLIYAKSSNSSDLKTWLAEGTTLQHEAYRDGNQGTEAEQKAETLRATTAHTEMALRMANAFGGDFIIGDQNLSSDVGNYLMAARGIGKFSDYVKDTYDSTADYWKLKLEGGRALLEWDGENDIKVKDANGNWQRVSGNGENDLKVWKTANLLGFNSEEQAELEEQFKKAGGVSKETVPGKFTWTIGTDFMPLDNGTTLGKQLVGKEIAANSGFTIDVTDTLMWKAENGRGFINTGNSVTDKGITDEFDLSLYNAYKSQGKMAYSYGTARGAGHFGTEMNLDEWRDQLSYRYFTKDRQLGVEQLQDSFIKNYGQQFGMPYFLGGGNLTDYPVDGTNIKLHNVSWLTEDPLGFDCGGGAMWNARVTLGEYFGVSPKDPAINALLPIVNQDWMTRQDWIATFSDKNRLMPSDFIFVDLTTGKYGKTEFKPGDFEHVATYVGGTAIEHYFPGFSSSKIGGNDLFDSGSDMITTKVGDDPRLGAKPPGFTGMRNFASYNDEQTNAGYKPQYTYGRTNWSLLIERYNRLNKKR